MNRNGVFDAMSPSAYPAKEQSHRKGVDALHEIHVYKSEQCSLQDVCKPEWHGMPCIAEDQSAEYRFFNNRCENDGVYQEQQ